ncbi:MAG: Dam family site-specific DNA-(adenine-N6)-methyltransferase [Pyrinomonadaceae bacterium]|nr:Dam family site-specific DNA-(adenine-N6)-methyltransferase [Pyrinomonadaceae bacterium]
MRNLDEGSFEPSEGSKPVDTLLRPPLKWAGGKRWLLPYLAPLWRPHASRRYVEPFCGGLACALGLKPKSALLNDINPHLINFYTELKHGLDATLRMRNDEATFYTHRSRFNDMVRKRKWQGAEAAQLFYYLNRTGFNGLCRFNRSGEFNVPFGQHNSINYITDFSRFPAALENWTFTNSDIESLPLDRKDFVYADPPYDVEFTTYSAGGFSWDDQIRTAEWLAAHRGPVVLSNQATPRIVRLYKKLGFKVSYLEGPRRISCNGNRSAAREVLATKGL